MSDDLRELPKMPGATNAPASDGPPQRLILEGFLRREELAHELGISSRTIDRWEALRKGPPRVSVGRTILYNIRSVREWLLSIEKKPYSIKAGRGMVGRG